MSKLAEMLDLYKAETERIISLAKLEHQPKSRADLDKRDSDLLKRCATTLNEGFSVLEKVNNAW